MAFARGFQEALSVFLDYDTPMLVLIKDKRVGVINRLTQLGIVAFIIFYVIIFNKGYQDFDDVKGVASIKVKGIIFENDTKFGPLISDVAEYVIPPRENDAFFVASSFVTTHGQKQGYCPENPYIREALCKDNSQCEVMKGTVLPAGNGPFTGNCVPSSIKGQPNVCEIFGWCPVEDDGQQWTQLLSAAANLTVLIKNHVTFPKFGVSRRNIMDWYKTNSELSNCRWKPDHPKDKYCPIFILGDIATAAGVSYSSLLKTGAVMKIIIDWTCDFDFKLEDCKPEYSFSRVDRGNYSVSVGFNFRYADHFSVSELDGSKVQYRNLHKMYGVHFLIEVRGKGGKFCVVPLMINIGSGLALLAIASIVCDIVILYLLKARDFYKDKKYLHVIEDPHEDNAEKPDDEA